MSAADGQSMLRPRPGDNWGIFCMSTGTNGHRMESLLAGFEPDFEFVPPPLLPDEEYAERLRRIRRAAVEAGLGATALSASVAAASIENGLLVAVPLNLPARGFYVLHHKDRIVSKAAQSLLAQIEGSQKGHRRSA